MKMSDISASPTDASASPLPSPAAISAPLYLATGWTPIPIKPKGKSPLIEWKTYQEKPPTIEEVRGWWTKWPTANVGIVTGATSGLVVVDLDSQEAVVEFLNRCG